MDLLERLICLVTEYTDANVNAGDKNNNYFDNTEAVYVYLKEAKLVSWAVNVMQLGYLATKSAENIKRNRKEIDAKIIYGRMISNYILEKRKKCFLSKGFVLSMDIYQNPYIREFGDIDFFCSQRDIYDISKYIEALGFVNSTKSKLSQIVDYGECLNEKHYGYDNENVFWHPQSNVLVEIKTGDYFAHGGFDDRQIESIFDDPSAVVSAMINGHKFPVLNMEYTFLMMVSNIYRNYNTRSGQVIDFKIRDLVDFIFFLKVHHVDCLTPTMRELFIKYNKMYELCIVLKYADIIFATGYIKKFISNSDLSEAVEAVVLYTPIEDKNRFVCDANYRIHCMEQHLCTLLKTHIEGKLPSEYVQCRYPVSTTRLFDEVYGQGLFLSISHCEREIFLQFYFDKFKAVVPLVLSVDIINLLYRDECFKYSEVIEITNKQIGFRDNPLNMVICENQNGFVLRGVISEDCLYNGWICFVMMGFYCGTEWADYACRLAEPDKPACYYIGL